MFNCYNEYMTVIGQNNQATQTTNMIEIMNRLQRKVSSSEQSHHQMVHGICFGILTSQQQAQKQFSSNQIMINFRQQAEKIKEHLFSQLNDITRDNYQTLTSCLCQIIIESYDVIRQNVLEDIVWILDRLILKTHAQNAKNLFVLLMRQIYCNVRDNKSVFLNKLMVDLSLRNLDSWIFQRSQLSHNEQFFSSLVLIKFMRLIEEHFQSIDFIQLRNKEAAICIKLWSQNQEECYQIGSEFMRIYFNIMKISELQPISDDLVRLH